MNDTINNVCDKHKKILSKKTCNYLTTEENDAKTEQTETPHKQFSSKSI